MKILGILLLTFFAAIGFSAIAGLLLSIGLHFIDYGSFGFSWFLPMFFVAAATVGYVVYFLQFWLSMRKR